MSDTGLMVSIMNELPNRYDVTVTVARDGGHLPDPAEFAVAAEQAASNRNASVMSAHTAENIISIVTVQTADRPAAVAVALATRIRSAKASGRQYQAGRRLPRFDA